MAQQLDSHDCMPQKEIFTLFKNLLNVGFEIQPNLVSFLNFILVRCNGSS
jgi:hypothetical protein